MVAAVRTSAQKNCYALLQMPYDKIDVAHDYSKDLHSYLNYCRDIVFPGIAYSTEEKHVIENFQDMYKRREDENPKVHMEEIPITNGANKRGRDGTFVSARCFSASSSGIRSIKSEMENHGFRHMPPRKLLRSDGYTFRILIPSPWMNEFLKKKARSTEASAGSPVGN